MKSTIKKLFVILAIVMSLVTVQSVSAEIIVTGSIDTILKQPNVVVVEGTEVYGVMFNYLDNKYGIDLSDFTDEVWFRVYEYECLDGSTKLMACEIAIEEGEWITLRDCL